MSRRLFWLLAVFAGIMAATWWTRAADPAARWAEIERRDLVLGVEVTGELEAEQAVELGPPQIRSIWNFKIAFMAPEGAEVERGETVLRFDTSELERKLQQERANADAASKRLEQRRSELAIQMREEELALAEAKGRRRQLDLEVDVPPEIQAANELRRARVAHDQIEDEVIARHDLVALLGEGSRAELKGLEERALQAEDSVRLLERQIASMTIGAPRAGTVVYLSDGDGDKKKVGDSAWRMEQVLGLPDLDRVVAAGEVREAESGRLEVGQAVILRLDAYPDRLLRGEVRRIHRTVQPRSATDPRKVTRLDIALGAGAGGPMRPGMRFTGTVEVERVAGALAIPLEAILAGDEGPLAQVSGLWQPRPRSLKLGARTDSHAEVLEGLEEGDKVLLR